MSEINAQEKKPNIADILFSASERSQKLSRNLDQWVSFLSGKSIADRNILGFYSRVLGYMQTKMFNDPILKMVVPTAAATKKGIFFNEDFFEKLLDEDKSGVAFSFVLIHELCHIVRHHIEESNTIVRSFPDQQAMQMACECQVNMMAAQALAELAANLTKLDASYARQNVGTAIIETLTNDDVATEMKKGVAVREMIYRAFVNVCNKIKEDRQNMMKYDPFLQNKSISKFLATMEAEFKNKKTFLPKEFLLKPIGEHSEIEFARFLVKQKEEIKKLIDQIQNELNDAFPKNGNPMSVSDAIKKMANSVDKAAKSQQNELSNSNALTQEIKDLLAKTLRDEASKHAGQNAGQNAGRKNAGQNRDDLDQNQNRGESAQEKPSFSDSSGNDEQEDTQVSSANANAAMQRTLENMKQSLDQRTRQQASTGIEKGAGNDSSSAGASGAERNGTDASSSANNAGSAGNRNDNTPYDETLDSKEIIDRLNDLEKNIDKYFGDSSEEEKNEIKKKIEQLKDLFDSKDPQKQNSSDIDVILQKAAREYIGSIKNQDSSKGIGSESAHIASEQLVVKEVDQTTFVFLADAVRESLAGVSKLLRNKNEYNEEMYANAEHIFGHPGLTPRGRMEFRKNSGFVSLILDTSGSVSGNELTKAVSDVFSSMQVPGAPPYLAIAHADTRITKFDVLDKREIFDYLENENNFSVFGRGGTEMTTPVMEMIEKFEDMYYRYGPPYAIIYVTDGEISTNEFSNENMSKIFKAIEETKEKFNLREIPFVFASYKEPSYLDQAIHNAAKKYGFTIAHIDKHPKHEIVIHGEGIEI